MTRSSFRRRNRNARMIAAAYPLADARSLVARHGAFDENSARRFAPFGDFGTFLDWIDGGDVNWSYCAELLNRRARDGRHGAMRVMIDRSAWTGVQRGWTQ